MQVTVLGEKAFTFLRFTLKPRESIKTESGAMLSMDAGIDLRSKLNGGFISAIFLRILGKESIFISNFKNQSNTDQEVVITQTVPGEVVQERLNGESLYIQPGAFLACTPGVKFSLRWAGFSSWLAKEGLFRLKIKGTGNVWYGGYGAIVEKEIDGEYIVDTGHLLSYPKSISLKIKMSGGIFSSIFSGEGLVLKLEGKGKVKLQTRSIGGVAGWLNPKFYN